MSGVHSLKTSHEQKVALKRLLISAKIVEKGATWHWRGGPGWEGLLYLQKLKRVIGRFRAINIYGQAVLWYALYCCPKSRLNRLSKYVTTNRN